MGDHEIDAGVAAVVPKPHDQHRIAVQHDRNERGYRTARALATGRIGDTLDAMKPRLLLLLLALAAAFAAVPVGQSAERTAFCRGTQLGGSFTAVPGSAGAGNIVYRLTLKNRSTQACAVTGLPVVRLLGRTGKPLPTHVRAAFPNGLTAILVTLAPGRSATATARFSPDVPGTGEQMTGPCEPTSYWLRVGARGGGTTKVRISPRTPVCEHGGMQFSAYGRR